MSRQPLVSLLLSIAVCVAGIQFSWYWLRRLRARTGTYTPHDPADRLPFIEIAIRVGGGAGLTMLGILLCTFSALTMMTPTWTVPDWFACVGLASVGLTFLLLLAAVTLAAVRRMRS